MSIDSTDPSHSCIADANDYAYQIHDIFNQHLAALDHERQESIEKIDQWRRDCKERIKNYAKEQKLFIDDYYNTLRPFFDKNRIKYREKANYYYAEQQIDLFNDLRKECELLKFQTAILKFFKHEMEYPEIKIVERQTHAKTPEGMNLARFRRRKENKMKGNNAENTIDAMATSPPNSVTSIAEQIDNQQSSKIKSKKKKDVQSTVDTDGLKDEALNNKQSDDKCPICFMIFPSTMTHDNRGLHVNEHYTDD